MRITQHALALARQENLDLTRLPLDQLDTESTVRAILDGKLKEEGFSIPASAFDSTAMIVFGGGGHGKSLIDLLRLLGTYHILGVVDDGIPKDTLIMGLPVLGGAEALPRLHALGVRLAVNAVGGIGNLAARVNVFQKLAEAGFACPAVIHPTAYVELSATLSPGVQIFPHAYVGSEARLGFGCIVNTGAIVSHDCVLGELANISPGAMLAGEVQIGAGVLVGMGATVNLQVKIGAGARIGNGATVKQDVSDRGVVRAGAIWPA
jgi:sugar O-acyltransferase (sialic acid O-acetyltransferase NeuD family)